ncbi:unnamed protein product [Rotaria magnacalcarata]
MTHKITGINEKKRSCQIKNSHTWLIQIIYVRIKQNYRPLYIQESPIHSYYRRKKIDITCKHGDNENKLSYKTSLEI